MRIERYTEVYLDDAMRLCKYIAKDTKAISIVMADPSLFPEPPKNIPFPETTYAVRVTEGDVVVCECAYITRREDGTTDPKHRNRWLYSIMIGEEVRAARERAGVTLDELGERTGYRPYSLDAIERGRYIMDTKLLSKIADALGCDIKLVEKSPK